MADIILDGTIGANRLLILDSTGKIPAVDGSQVTTIAAGNIATGTIPIARVDTGTTANKIVVLDGSGRLPAVSGALITGISGATKSASDPTLSTNPSGGVGTEWHNTTSGEVYICTDATAGANVWINVGEGTRWPNTWHIGGTQKGFLAGGYVSSSYTDVIETFSFTSDVDATDWADLYGGRQMQAAGKSSTYAYASGGDANSPLGGKTTNIEKFPFASQTNGTSVGNLTQGRRGGAGTASATYSYCMSGGGPSNTGYDLIDKWAHASDGNATSVGGVVQPVQEQASHSSATHGYMSGGRNTSSGGPANDGFHGKIEKHSFATDADSTTVGDLINSTRRGEKGTQSKTYGYTFGGRTASANVNTVEKFPFATDANSTDVLDLLVTRRNGSGHATETHGYAAGGQGPGTSGNTDVIEKWNFAAQTNATNVGDLTVAKSPWDGWSY